MNFFIRHTITPDEDLVRGTSIDVTPYDKDYLKTYCNNKENILIDKIKQEYKGYPVQEIKFSPEYDAYIVVQAGLYGFTVYNEYDDDIDLNTALAVFDNYTIDPHDANQHVGPPHLYAGDYLHTGEDGEIFRPTKLIK